ncbi:hypothetical protein [Stenotrophomonas sp. PD6]|uniref:hypothetical protein n=1 Tax=Stenotrophomonas sp. PD6 TaxID=3368612 RepID=UPI003B9F724A
MSDLDKELIFNRTVQTEFADRIDDSSDEKLNILGLYHAGAMEVHRSGGIWIFPGLDVRVSVESNKSDPIRELVIFVFFDEELVARTEFSPEEISEVAEITETDLAQGGLPAQWFGWSGRIGARLIHADSVIRVRVLTEQGVMAGGALRIVATATDVVDEHRAL